PLYVLGEPHAKPPAAPELVGERQDPLGLGRGLAGNGTAERPFGTVPNGFVARPFGDGHGLDERRPASAWGMPPLRAPSNADRVDLERDLAEYEKAILLRALDQAGGVKK